MEASSPLAAMRAPSMPAWGGGNSYYPHNHNRSHTSGGNLFAPGAFNFRDLSMKSSRGGDYFQMAPPVRGSSPTASLAADLSQNFHIDMSTPPLVTPRRNLFSQGGLFATYNGRESATTPPIPSSSPGVDDSMDISPLPHKQPYCAQIDVHSPTPDHTPTEEMFMPSSPPRAAFAEASPRPGLERKKSILHRPSLSRAKGYSTNSMPSRIQPESQLPPFRFGAGSSKLSTESMSLGECFLESPPQERRPQSANSPSVNPPKLGKPFGGFNGNSMRNGSPIGSHTRRPSNPLVRPRKQFRRTLSMFEHPGDVMKGKKEETSTLHTVMDVDELHQPVLPHFYQEGRPDSIPRITKETLLNVLDGQYDSSFHQRMIIDCRFEYEFEGGHIDGAVNFNDKCDIASQLFEAGTPGKTLLVFHCEYSAHRAPMMARHVRQQDRAINVEQYPKLTYPEVYILDGGYSKFFSEHRDRCYPQNYIEMDDKAHAGTCEREMGKLRNNRAKFSRAKTFAFGSSSMDDSPTAPSRGKSGGDDLMMSGMCSPLGSERAFARRMASY